MARYAIEARLLDRLEHEFVAAGDPDSGFLTARAEHQWFLSLPR